MSDRKANSNRSNAMQSTGPISAAGKARSSQNALQHGILSGKLLLPTESAHEFGALLSQLQLELSPVGVMECALVERVAIALWRQRRLVAAETASISLQQQDLTGKDFMSIMVQTGVSPRDKVWVDEIARDPPDLDDLGAAAAELDQLQILTPLELSSFSKKCPRAWLSLLAESEIDVADVSLSECVARVRRYLAENKQSLEAWLDDYGAHVRRLLRVASALSQVRQAATLPANADVLSRYQSALDNDMYKAMRALREQQKHRLEQAALNAAPINQ
jgi:hypothetical protein